MMLEKGKYEKMQIVERILIKILILIRKIASTNVIWSCTNDLRNNLNDMLKHKRVLEDTIVKVETGLKSSHTGIDYDWRTIANPRRHAAAVQPAVGLVKQANSTFF